MNTGNHPINSFLCCTYFITKKLFEVVNKMRLEVIYRFLMVLQSP